MLSESSTSTSELQLALDISSYRVMQTSLDGIYTFSNELEPYIDELLEFVNIPDAAHALTMGLQAYEDCVTYALMYIPYVPASLIAKIVRLYAPTYEITYGIKASVRKRS